MIIKKSRRREWARLLAKVIVFVMIMVAVAIIVRVERIEGNSSEPNYKDGDLIIMRRSDDAPFLQLRVRGFDD